MTDCYDGIIIIVMTDYYDGIMIIVMTDHYDGIIIIVMTDYYDGARKCAHVLMHTHVRTVGTMRWL